MNVRAGKRPIRAAVRERVAGLSPAYFAMVMATGIVSIAAQLHGMPLIGRALFWLNLAVFAVLWALYLARLALAPGRFLDDLKDHVQGVGFFTVVAGTGVLGAQFVVIRNDPRTAAALWLLCTALWFVLLYAIFTILMVKSHKPPLEKGLNGAWLLPVVATQSVSVLGGLLAGHFTGRREEVLFFSLAVWLGGGMLYIWIIALIFYRYMFFTLAPEDLTPPYWINMGAMAISTLAGAGLITAAQHSALVRDLLPFLKGMTLFFWATATFWVPMLLILGAWRHIHMRFSLRYDPAYWGGVFPLGMYAVCTYRLAGALDAPFLLTASRGFVHVALAAWLAVLLGLVQSALGPSAKGAQGPRSTETTAPGPPALEIRSPPGRA